EALPLALRPGGARTRPPLPPLSPPHLRRRDPEHHCRQAIRAGGGGLLLLPGGVALAVAIVGSHRLPHVRDGGPRRGQLRSSVPASARPARPAGARRAPLAPGPRS